jgi:transketolase
MRAIPKPYSLISGDRATTNVVTACIICTHCGVERVGNSGQWLSFGNRFAVHPNRKAPLCQMRLKPTFRAAPLTVEGLHLTRHHVSLNVMTPMSKVTDLAELKAICKRVRADIIEMIGAAKSGHPGGSLSAVELLVALYYNVMRHDPKNPSWEMRDRFILSKGHAAPVLYSVFAELGMTPKDQLHTLRRIGSIYQGHPDRRFIPALEASTGSLGQGLSLGLGMACAAKLDNNGVRSYVVLGDGEVQEGQIWEAAMFASFHKVDNCVCIVDYNKIQLDGFVKDILGMEPFADKWKSFGWHVVEFDGHDMQAVLNAFAEAEATKGKPTVLIAHTIKGKGVSFMENNPKYHGVAPTAEEVQAALKELELV